MSGKNVPPFYSDCVGWPADRMEALEALISDADDIDLAAFSKLIGPDQLRELSKGLGYATSRGEQGIRLKDDYHVGYKLHRDSGIPFMVHSAIEMVYATPEAIDALQIHAEEAVLREMESCPDLPEP